MHQALLIIRLGFRELVVVRFKQPVRKTTKPTNQIGSQPQATERNEPPAQSPHDGKPHIAGVAA
jgi:hypothetical protein